MKKTSIVLLLCIAACVRADLLTDIVSGNYKPATLSEMTPMPQGGRYAALSGTSILAYSYATGAVEDTLFQLSSVKGVRTNTIEGYLLSPDERYMLVYKDMQQVYRRSFRAKYFLYDIQRGELSALADSALIQAPQFSPDSRYIAFSKDNNLYIHKIAFGTEVAVTDDGNEGGIINGTPDWLYEEEFSTTCLFAFSPDSKQLAFVRLDESEVPTFSWQEFLGGGYPQTHSLKYPRAGETNARACVMVYDTYYKSLKQMQTAEGDIYIPRIKWMTTDALAIFQLNRNQNKLEMLAANPKSTVCKRLYIEESKDAYVDFEQIDDWCFLSDGSFIVVNETDGWRHVWQYSAAGQKQRLLSVGEYDVMQVYGYDEAAQTLYFQAAAPTPMMRTIYAFNVKKNKLTQLSAPQGTHNAAFSSDYAWFVDSYTTCSLPNRYTLCKNTGKEVRVLLNNDSLQQCFDALQLPQKQFFSFTTERGDTLNGWMLLPVGFDNSKQYPVLQVQYSGPASQMVLDRWKIDWEYWLSTQGVIVVCVDGRGTGARGRRFRMQTYMHIGQMEAEDQVSVARHMQSLPYVKSDRIGIWGWSYGGFMTLMSMSQPDAPFRCGIAVAPVTDFRLYDSAYTERFMRRPQANEAGYNDCALPLKADALQGRLLLVHGVADDNVHCQNAWVYVDALIKAGKQFDMQIYPDDNHFLKKRSNYQHLYQRMADFVTQHLLD
ncbi:MAG: S9 family peptidase [Paludibacter sp.]|nr:S9 family peptidase [Bacteroidales bacterium]MCM1069856.1 S9 family peptidase [Prevotella sp.]MCM1353071.1 S9 family peptidase [Bacteroides sp.]MCM1443428.1 S9 family peptidase [Muribaculum sp.]MCM1481236.1 S9 family peptidase [Paludibacter sp.]